MAASRGLHAFGRRACRSVNFKSNGNLLKTSSSTTQLLSTIRQNSSLTSFNLSPKTRQLLNITKNNKWNNSVFDSISRSSSSAIICLLSTGNSQLTHSLCACLDELSSEGDEDSTNRKKRIYIVGLLNDDP